MTAATRFRIRITKVGYLFILLTLGVGISGLNTGNNLLYLVFSMMLSFIILSGLLSNSTLTRLEIRPQFPGRIFAREAVPVHIELENRKRRFPSFSLSLAPATEWKGETRGTFIIKIPPKGSCTTTDFVRFPKRGTSQLPPYIVRTTYPFGLIQKYTTIPSSGEAIVYPALLQPDSLITSDRRLSGDYLSGQTGGASNPYGIRDFVEGDPARLIHWKTSARSGELKVKEFEREKRHRVYLDVSLAPKAKSDADILEKALSAAASLLLLFADRGFEQSMRLNGKQIEPKGHGYLDAYLSALALASPSSNENSKAKLPEENVVFITDNPEISAPPGCVLFFGPKELVSL